MQGEKGIRRRFGVVFDVLFDQDGLDEQSRLIL